ncbi:hypothetical protein Fcan01_06849 [Folsomia candida]|uniref:Uncharacterized protein n=1 Tax=Folsomia candida TaxID=158441 RepID=A0A226EJM0_FOLCA|nr:hypothetical protein Fcan01_06849 [Folsomia candida]
MRPIATVTGSASMGLRNCTIVRMGWPLRGGTGVWRMGVTIPGGGITARGGSWPTPLFPRTTATGCMGFLGMRRRVRGIGRAGTGRRRSSCASGGCSIMRTRMRAIGLRMFRGVRSIVCLEIFF